jgi:hypothetical protein
MQTTDAFPSQWMEALVAVLLQNSHCVMVVFPHRPVQMREEPAHRTMIERLSARGATVSGENPTAQPAPVTLPSLKLTAEREIAREYEAETTPKIPVLCASLPTNEWPQARRETRVEFTLCNSNRESK